MAEIPSRDQLIKFAGDYEKARLRVDDVLRRCDEVVKEREAADKALIEARAVLANAIIPSGLTYGSALIGSRLYQARRPASSSIPPVPASVEVHYPRIVPTPEGEA